MWLCFLNCPFDSVLLRGNFPKLGIVESVMCGAIAGFGGGASVALKKLSFPHFTKQRSEYGSIEII